MRSIALMPSLCVCFCWNAWSQPYTIHTLAGTTRLQEGGNATSTPLRQPIAVAADSNGNIYIADESDNRVRKVDKNGIITTIAGTGEAGFSGDRGPAAAAQLALPTGIALDPKGNLYIADAGNAVIRRVSTDGTINTIAGNGNPSAAGDNGPAASAQIDPVALALDTKGNYYISDGFNYRIRKVDANGIITTIAGVGRLGYSGDNGPATSATIGLVTDIQVDSAGNIYLADYYNSAVRKIDTSGMITTIAGTNYGYYEDGIPATQAVMLPAGLALDGSGSLYISDPDGYHTVIRRMDLSTGLIYTVAGTGQVGFQGDGGVAVAAQLNNPGGLAVSGGTLYIADTNNVRVRKVASFTITTVAGTSTRDNGPATEAFLNLPEGLAVDGTGNIIIADTSNNAVRRFQAGANINSFGQVLGAPFGVAVDQAGNFYVTDEEAAYPGQNPHVLKVQPDGTTSIIAGNGPDGYGGDGAIARGAGLNLPRGIAVDAAGNIYLADYGNNRVRKIDTQGIISTIGGNGKALFSGDGGLATAAGMNPSDVAVDNQRNVFVADRVNHRIRKIALSGMVTTVAGNGIPGYKGDGGPATEAELTAPTGIAIDQAASEFGADFNRRGHGCQNAQ
jgi:sugar lactone lactonase YvrE